MLRRLFFATVGVVVIGLTIFTFLRGLSGPVMATDLVVGKTYKVADFETCSLPNGSGAHEWHFGGGDRSRRNQLTPAFDGRGRRILRKSSDIPAGTMRLRKVVEHAEDPMLEGFKYGTYINHWEGLVIEYNGRIESQSVVRPCGPARS